jgi:plasmid stabilization system protein ParE
MGGARIAYLIIYEIHETRDGIIVLGVFHGAQDWQERLK